MGLSALPESWTVWSEEPGRIVLAFRPDVFDGDEFPAPCLPTIYVTRGRRSRRPGGQRVGSEWRLQLQLEPDVEVYSRSYEDRASAVEGAVEEARAFVDGAVDPREHYQVPRPDYLDRLAELTDPERGDATDESDAETGVEK